VGHHRVVTPGLKLLRQPQNALAGLEEDLYGPALPVNPHNFFVGNGSIRAEYGQPLPLRAALPVPHEHHLDRQGRSRRVLPVVHLHEHGAEDVLFPEDGVDLPVQPRELHPLLRSVLPPYEELHGIEVLDHGDGMDAFPVHGVKELVGGKPGIEEKKVGFHSVREYRVQKNKSRFRRFHHRFFPSPCPRCSSIGVRGSEEPVLLLRRTEKGEGQRQKGPSVRPAEGEHAEPPEMAMIAVVVALRQELHLFAPVPRVGGIVENKYPVSSLHGEREKEGVKKPLCEDQQETPPVDSGLRKEAVERVLAPRQAVLAHHLEEGFPEEDEGKKKLQDPHRRDPLSLPG
jgi:hypothetical protein